MILVTTDGSQRSTNVLSHAVALARICKEQISLLRVFDPAELASELNSRWPAALKREVEALEQGMDRLLETASVSGETHAEPLLKGESVPQAILRFAAQTDTSLIAMDSRGHGALRHALLGSVAMEVIAHSPLPVMVTGSEIGPVDVKDSYVIVATTDCSSASEQVFHALEAIWALPQVSVALTNVYVPALADRGDQAEVQGRYELLADIQRRLLSGARCELIVRRARDLTMPESLVLDTARDMKASTIAMSTKGHSAKRHVVLGSFAAAVLGRSPLPVILVKA